MKKSIIMGFDFGLKNIGIAVGQKLTDTAQPITTLQAKTGIPNWNEIQKILCVWKPKILIVGLPININGTDQPLTHTARQFSITLHEKFNLKVLMHDERFSTTEARSNLFAHHGYNALKEKQINALSAVVILESWLQHV